MAPRLPALVAALALLTAACSDGAAPVVPDEAPSALRGDRDDPSFPEPLVPVADIVSGGPPPDGIPPIDEPVFASVAETEGLDDAEAVVTVTVDDETKAYPVRILVWHELVNDEIGGVPVTVSYCPLCNSALAYDRRVGDTILDFGTSGELYQSALVMYDRQTESLWTHFDGTAVVGALAGVRLELLPAQTVSWGTLRTSSPDALVLTTDTGARRDYGVNPYVGYDDPGSGPIGGFFLADVDEREAAKERVVGVETADGPVAVRRSDVAEQGAVTVGDLVVLHRDGLASSLDRAAVATGRDIGEVGVFRPVLADGTPVTFTLDGGELVDEATGSVWNAAGVAVDGELAGSRLEPVPHLDTFWFAWAVYRPDTTILEP